MHNRLVSIVVAALTMGCPAKVPIAPSFQPYGEGPLTEPSAPTGDPVQVAAMRDQHGWSKSDTMGWLWADDGGGPPASELGASQGARGIQIITLPSGVSEAMLTMVWVAYTAPGDVTWTVYAVGADGEPVGEPLARVRSRDVHNAPVASAPIGQTPVWTEVDFGDGPTVRSPFALVFTADAGAPMVGASPAEDGAVRYQGVGATTSQPVPYKAHVRVQVLAY